MAGKEILVGAGLAAAALTAYFLLRGKKPEEGNFTCIGDDMYQFIGGEWVLYAENHPSCTPAECIEGSCICQGNDLYRCVDGEWVLEQENHPDCMEPDIFTLYGKVVDDDNGIIVIGARVAIDGLSDSTDASGNFQFTNLAPGRYTGSCTKEDYLPRDIDVQISEDKRLDIRLTPVPGWPYVELAICPYCGDIYYAPDALDKLFDHVEAEHLPAGQGYYFCGFCGAEFTELMDLFRHWVDQHLALLTQVPEATVYLPEQAIVGEQVSLRHVFNLIQRPGGFYTVNVRLVRGGTKPYISSVKCVAPDLLVEHAHCFPGYIELDHTGQYTVEETVTIPADLPEGSYSIFSVAKYQHIKSWGVGCGRSYDQEYTTWNIDTGKTIYIGTPTPPPPTATCTCVYCGDKFDTREELLSHIESEHSNTAHTLCGSLSHSELAQGTPFTVSLEFFAKAGGPDDFYQLGADIDGESEWTDRIPADGQYHNLVIPFLSGWRISPHKPDFFEIWTSCMYVKRISSVQFETLWLWRDSPTDMWLLVTW